MWSIGPGQADGNLRDASANWPNQIFAVHSRRLALKSRDRLLALDPSNRLRELLRILEQDFVGMEDLAAEFQWDEWPVPILLAGGKVELRLLRDLKQQTELIVAPRLKPCHLRH